MPKKSKTGSISVAIPPDPDALFPFILSIADLITDLNTSGLSIFSSVADFLLASWNSSFTYSLRLWNVSCFSIINESSFDFTELVHLLTFRLVNSFTLFCIFSVFVLLTLSISAHVLLSHSSLSNLHLYLISVFSVRYSFPFIGIVCCHFFRIFSLIHSSHFISFSEVTSVSFSMLYFHFVVWFWLYSCITVFYGNTDPSGFLCIAV